MPKTESRTRIVMGPESFASSLSGGPLRRTPPIGRWGWLVAGCLFTMAAHAQNATWSATPTTSNWNIGANWVGGVPPLQTDTATFSASDTTTITFSANAVASALVFTGAPAYTFDVTHGLSFSQAGVGFNPSGPSIFNISGAGSFIQFSNTIGSAGDSIIKVNAGGVANFQNATSAGSASITNNGGETDFRGTSTAGNAIITTNSSGHTIFFDTSTGGTATFVTNTGGTFDISDLTTSGGTTVGSISGGGTYALGANALTVGTNVSTEVSGIITDGGISSGVGGRLIKIGTGTLTLSGINTYTGGTTISNGTLQIGNGLTTGSIIGDVVDNAILAFNRSDTIEFAGDISGAGSLNQIGSGTLILSGSNNYGGGTTITAGTLQIGNGGTTGSILGNVVDRGILAFNRSDVVSFLGNISGVGGLNQMGIGTTALSGNNTYLGVTTISAGTLRAGSITAFSSDSAFTVTGTLDLNGFSNAVASLAGAGIVTNNGGAAAILVAGGFNTSTTFSGILQDGSATLGLIKVGAGTMVLSGANTYSGGTTVLGGVLSVSADGNLGNPTGGITLEGGELLTTADGFSSARAVTIGPGSLAAATGTTATYTGVISGNGGLQIGDGANTGTVVLGGGANTYTGGTTVSGGAALSVNSNADLGDLSGPITLNGGKLITGQFTTLRTLMLTGAGTLAAPGTGLSWTATYNGLVAGSGALTVGDPNSSTLTVVLANAGNDYTGGTTITGGATVEVAVDAALGSGGITLNGGSLETTTNGFVSGRPINLIPNILANLLNSGAGSDTTATYNGVISGLGALTTSGGGNVVLGGANTYSGGTHIGFGVLSVADDANLGDPSGGITLDAGTLLTTADGFTSARPILLVDSEGHDTLAAVNGTTAAYTGPISGDGALFIGNFDSLGGTPHAGTVVLTNVNNSYTGGTTITNGAILSVSANAQLGAISGGITLDDGELLTTGNGFTSARTIQLGGSFLNTLAAATATTATYTGVITGDAILTVGDFVNEGSVVLSGNNTYDGGTAVRGNLVAAGNNALGTGEVQMFRGNLTILDGVTLTNEIAFEEGGTVNNAGTLNGNITDAFSVAETVINSGTINGNVILGGATDVVQLFTGGKISGSVELAGTTSSTLILDGAGQQLLSQAVLGTITNNGSLVKQGTGTWTIDRGLTAPVETDVLAGTLIVEAALTTPQVNIASEGTLQLNSGGSVGNLVDNGSLIFAGTGTVNFTSVISGTGNVIQNGTGTTILSGRNTYSGGTIIELGTLLVNNPQALGTGNVVVNGGVLGADPQPINVLANYTQNAGGTLQLNIAGRAAGQFDVLNVTGNAGLNGTLRLLNQGYQPQNGDKLKLVTTGGTVTGRFATVQNPFTLASGFNTIALVYARQSVTLEFLKLNPTPPPPSPPGPPIVVSITDFASFAFTPNQRAAAHLLDATQLDPRAANLVSFFNQEPFADYQSDFDKISPQGLTAFYEITFSNANIQRLNLDDRLDDIHHGSNGFSSNMKVNGGTVSLESGGADGKSFKNVVEPVLQHTRENRWGVWVTGFGDFVSVDADSNAQGYNFTTGGVTLGIDFRITDQLAIGIMGDYSHTWTSINPAGHMDVNSGRGGVYATWYNHGLYFNGAIYGGYNSYDSGRSGLAGLATGSTQGAEWSTYISGGYDFHFGALTVGPIAALQYTSVGIDGFSEQGSLAPLDIHSDSAQSLRSDVGFRVFYQWQVGKVLVTPSLTAGWEHEYKYSALPITAGFAGIPGPSATFFGPNEGHDSAIISAGVSVQLSPSIVTYLNYDGQLGRENYDSNAVTGGVRISF